MSILKFQQFAIPLKDPNGKLQIDNRTSAVHVLRTHFMKLQVYSVSLKNCSHATKFQDFSLGVGLLFAELE